MSDRAESHGAAELVVEERFAIVPEWLLDADVDHCAVRLYAARPRGPARLRGSGGFSLCLDVH
jgi:hypothetical protein